MSDRANRTEQPTPRKLDRARREGNVPRTKELSGAFVLLVFLLFGRLFGGDWLLRLERLLASTFDGAVRPDLTPDQAVALLTGVAASAAMLIFPPIALLAVAGLGGNLIQGPPPLTLQPLKPDLTRINVVRGLKKLFRLRSIVELLKALLKLVLFSAVAIGAVYETLAGGLPGAPGAHGAFSSLAALIARVVLRVALLALALALVDWLYQRWDFTRQQRMTKQEVKDERREVDGDPMVKARIRSRQLALARSRMMSDVARATVVVTNPTHYAVALRYVPGEMDVPQVLAKGRNKLADRIREIATQHRVPIVSDPPLARALYRAVEVGSFIPQQLFRAVAEILALVLRRGPRAAHDRPPLETR